MRATIIVFPGSNCDRDVQVAIASVTGQKPTMVWHGDSDLPKTDLIVLPGGFAHGDYLRCGAIAAHSPIMKDVVRLAEAGTPVLAICNGFQIAIEAGLLPGALVRNANLKFICKPVHLRVENTHTPFTHMYDEDEVIRLPIANHDGNYIADADTLAALTDEARIVFRYCDGAGDVSEAANPNGSVMNIAGIANARRTILGMMPHPERFIDEALGSDDGRSVFGSLMGALS
jgi:phosphoribosylformylglycinamidine synthase